MASLKMMRFSNVLRLVLSVGAKRRPKIDMSSMEWFGKLKCFENIAVRVIPMFIVEVNFVFDIPHLFDKSVVKLSGSFANIKDVAFDAGDEHDDDA